MRSERKREDVERHCVRSLNTAGQNFSLFSPRPLLRFASPHSHSTALGGISHAHALARTHSTHQHALGGPLSCASRHVARKPEHENTSCITLTSLMVSARATAVDGHRSPIGSLYSLTRVAEKKSSKASVVQKNVGGHGCEC